MKLKVTYRGFKEVDAKLSRLRRGSPAIARAAVNAGLAVLASAAKAAAPGTIGREIGWYVRGEGNHVHGRAGLMQFPNKGDGQNGPHGIYLDRGTKFIQARHFIGRALNSSMQRAIQAAKNAGHRTAQKIASGK